MTEIRGPWTSCKFEQKDRPQAYDVITAFKMTRPHPHRNLLILLLSLLLDKMLCSSLSCKYLYVRTYLSTDISLKDE